MISLLTCFPDRVLNYLELNYDKIISSKYNVKLAINWNRLDKVPELKYKDLEILNFRTIDVYPNYPDKSVSNWNIARFSNMTDSEFDYILIQDDDVIYKTHIDKLLDEVYYKEVEGLVLLQARGLRPYREYDLDLEIRKLSDKYVIRKRNRSTPTYAGNQGGQLISRKFLLDNYKLITSYNGHGEDCIRSGLAFIQDKFYATAGNVMLSYYDFKGYPKTLQVKSAIEASKMNLFPVIIKGNTEWNPVSPVSDTVGLLPLSDNLFVKDNETKFKLFNNYKDVFDEYL